MGVPNVETGEVVVALRFEESAEVVERGGLRRQKILQGAHRGVGRWVGEEKQKLMV